MKQIRLFLMLVSVACSLAAQSQEPEKRAILMVHFGTTYDETRAKTIDAINARVQSAFPDQYVTESYTSRIVLKRLKAKGIERPTPREAMIRLAAEGYTHLFVQCSYLLEGIEMATLQHEVEQMSSFFKDIRVGRPLLYSVEDCQKVVEILAEAYPAKDRNSHVVFVGHGTDAPAGSVYSQLDYMFTAQGHSSHHVATIEGYPTQQNLLDRIKLSKAKHITLVPLLFVAGDHANNDIAVDWKEAFEVAGYKTEAKVVGLGQMPAIQELFVDHIREGLQVRPRTLIEQKAHYIQENL